MEKNVCDICGTSYPDSEERCPVCGCPRDFLLEDSGSVRAPAETEEYSEEVTEALFANARKKNRVFDYDEVNQEKRPQTVQIDDEEEDEEEVYEEGSRTNVFLVVILVILIVLLLLAAGFFFVRYFLPNMTEDIVETEPVVTTEAATEPTETEDLGIPCTNLMMDGGKMELGKDGKKLLNVHVYPEDTTDAVVYTSGDEAVVTVSEDGTVSAVGEGTTVITVTCGEQQIKCNVTVSYAEVEVTVPDETIPAMEVDNADATEPAQETTAAESGETTAASEETVPAGTELKLKKTDITIGSNYTSVRLEMDCDVDPEDMTWFTMDCTIAIVHGGVVTSTGSGLTRIYGEYNGQQVECIVRCIF